MMNRIEIIGMEATAIAAGEYGLAGKEAELYIEEKLEERKLGHLKKVS